MVAARQGVFDTPREGKKREKTRRPWLTEHRLQPLCGCTGRTWREGGREGRREGGHVYSHMQGAFECTTVPYVVPCGFSMYGACKTNTPVTCFTSRTSVAGFVTTLAALGRDA